MGEFLRIQQLHKVCQELPDSSFLLPPDSRILLASLYSSMLTGVWNGLSSFAPAVSILSEALPAVSAPLSLARLYTRVLLAEAGQGVQLHYGVILGLEQPVRVALLPNFRRKLSGINYTDSVLIHSIEITLLRHQRSIRGSVTGVGKLPISYQVFPQWASQMASSDQ